MRDTRRHGFIETVSNGRVTKTLWLNGHEMVKYRFPKIQARFSSPLVSEDNLHLCGARSWTPYAGGPWLDIDQTIVDRVLSGLKPVGFAGLTSAAWLQLVERRARASEVTTLTRPHAFPHVHCEIGLARPGTVGGTFDLEALEHDYRNYLASAPAEAVAEAVGLIHALESRPIAAFLPTFARDPHSIADLVEMGLLLGYPIETTAAIVGQRVRIAGTGVRSCV